MGVDFFDGLSNLLKPGNSALAFSISRATQTLLRRPETGRTQGKKKPQRSTADVSSGGPNRVSLTSSDKPSRLRSVASW
jgi:hypothetical protein